MIGVVVWPIFQIQRLVTASAGPRATILHLYLEDIYISSIIHISTHDLLVNLDIYFLQHDTICRWISQACKKVKKTRQLCGFCLVNVTL